VPRPSTQTVGVLQSVRTSGAPALPHAHAASSRVSRSLENVHVNALPHSWYVTS
jgi:hypothetical protein